MSWIKTKAIGSSEIMGTKHISKLSAIFGSAMEYLHDVIKVNEMFFWKYTS